MKNNNQICLTIGLTQSPSTKELHDQAVIYNLNHYSLRYMERGGSTRGAFLVRGSVSQNHSKNLVIFILG